MTLRDTLHLNALRACRTHVQINRFKGKRRDREAEAFLDAFRLGMLHMTYIIPTLDVDADFSHEFYLVGVRGYREVEAQLHILELAEREGKVGKLADAI